MSKFWKRLVELNTPFIVYEARKLLNAIDSYKFLPIGAILVFNKEGVYSMGAITVKDSDAPFTGVVTFLDAKGATTNPDDIPAWESDDESVAAVTASEDGLTGTVSPGVPGAAVITVSSVDADGTEVVAQGTVTVQPGEATIGNVDFTPPTQATTPA